MNSECRDTKVLFRFLPGWPSTKTTYDSNVRAHVLQNHIATRRSRKKQYQRLNGNNKIDPYPFTQLPKASALADGESQIVMFRREAPQATICFFQQASIDPFHTFARPLSNVEYFLIQRYLHHDYPWYAAFKSKPRFQPSSKIFFYVNASDALSLDTMIFYGASSLANSSGSPQMKYAMVKYQSDVIHSIRHRIQVERQAPSTALIIAVTESICTVLETVSGDRNDLAESRLVKLHVKGLRSLMKSKKGWDEIKNKSMAATWLVLWVDMQLGGMVLQGQTRFRLPMG